MFASGQVKYLVVSYIVDPTLLLMIIFTDLSKQNLKIFVFMAWHVSTRKYTRVTKQNPLTRMNSAIVIQDINSVIYTNWSIKPYQGYHYQITNYVPWKNLIYRISIQQKNHTVNKKCTHNGSFDVLLLSKNWTTSQLMEVTGKNHKQLQRHLIQQKN